MTPGEYVRQEAAAIEERSGCYLPPYRLAVLTELANKVMKLITGGALCMSYRECRLVLKIVAGAIDAAVSSPDGEPRPMAAKGGLTAAGEEENDA